MIILKVKYKLEYLIYLFHDHHFSSHSKLQNDSLSKLDAMRII